MKIEYRRDLRHQYLVIHSPENTAFGYRAEMILNNELENFARCFSEELNGRKIFYHEIPSGYYSLSVYLEQNGAADAFYRRMMQSLAAALRELEEYLLEPAEIMLEPEYIFLDEREMLFLFVYYPQSDLSFPQKCIGLSERLLHKIKKEERGAVEIGYLFYRNCVKEYITAELLSDMARTQIPENAWTSARPKREEAAAQQEDAAGDGPDPEEDYSFLFEKPEKPKKAKEGRRHLPRLFGKKNRKEKSRKEIPEENDTPFFPEENTDPELETVLLKPGRTSVRGWLIPKDTKEEKIPLEKERLLIGKSVAGADIFLDYAAVSRIHARISWDTDAYGVTDLGSKNGTTVNGIPIRPGEWIRLKEDDEIGIADRYFIYCPAGR